MGSKGKPLILIIIVAVIVIAVVVVGCLLVFKKKNVPAKITQELQMPAGNGTDQTGTVDVNAMSKAAVLKQFEGMSKADLQAAYDVCIQHPEISAGKFDCSYILEAMKGK